MRKGSAEYKEEGFLFRRQTNTAGAEVHHQEVRWSYKERLAKHLENNNAAVGVENPRGR